MMSVIDLSRMKRILTNDFPTSCEIPRLIGFELNKKGRVNLPLAAGANSSTCIYLHVLHAGLGVSRTWLASPNRIIL
jgi:hypothetical protein